jgi:hypothetical protein
VIDAFVDALVRDTPGHQGRLRAQEWRRPGEGSRKGLAASWDGSSNHIGGAETS